MSDSLKTLNKNSSQRERTLGRTDEVKNNAGGFVFEVSDKDRLERFLILGTDGGTFYVKEPQHTRDNADFLIKLIEKDETLVRETAVDVSVKGRAYKNNAAIFTVAALMVFGKDKAAAVQAVNSVCRTATHMYTYAQYIENLGGWGKAKRRSVATWLESKDAVGLSYQAIKYRQRNGWTLRDLMRLSHPTGVDPRVADFILGKDSDTSGLELIDGFRALQAAKDEKAALAVLDKNQRLPWEALPTDLHKSAAVWKKLFYNGQLNGQAQVRNITRLARLGAFDDMQFAADFAKALTSKEMLTMTRLHPVNLLLASVTYAEGQLQHDNDYWGYSYYMTRKKDWKNNSVITDALNDAFHLSFKTIKPAGKRTMLGIDVSGSMSTAAMGIDLSCAQVSAAIAMTVARTEPAHEIRGFSTQLVDLGISANTSLSEAMRKVQRHNFGGTDCSQPMLWALQNNVAVDTFVVITDNQTWAGRVKPFDALKRYRDKMGIDARLAVLGVASTNFTIADPRDRGMMDFVGFDSGAPAALADFSAGRI